MTRAWPSIKMSSFGDSCLEWYEFWSTLRTCKTNASHKKNLPPAASAASVSDEKKTDNLCFQNKRVSTSGLYSGTYGDDNISNTGAVWKRDNSAPSIYDHISQIHCLIDHLDGENTNSVDIVRTTLEKRFLLQTNEFWEKGLVSSMLIYKSTT